MKYLSVVIPAFNEARRLKSTLHDITRYLSSLNEDSEIIIVNDGSTDNTEQLIRNFMADLDDMVRFKIQLLYIHLKQNQGKGAALKKGILETSGQYVLFMDADNATNIREISKLMPFVESTYDIAIGSRNIQGAVILKHQPYLREKMGKIFNKIVRLTTVRGFIDTQCGFKLFRKKAAHAICAESKINGFACDVEMLYIAKKMGYKIIEVPITWEDNPDSRIQMFSNSVSMLKDVLRIKSLHKNLKKT